MCKIMTVDDDPTITKTIQMALNKQGFKTDVASNGIEFLEKISKSEDKPKVVLLDIMMPGLKTEDILNRLKEKNEDVKIIIVSILTFTRDELNELSKLYPITDYVQKPFTYLI